MSTVSVLARPKPGGIRGLIVRHPLTAYFVIAFTGAWLAVSPVLLAKDHLGLLLFVLDAQWFEWLGGLTGPTLAAFLVTGLTVGRHGIVDLLRRYVRWRVGLQWYLIALFGPLAILTLGSMVVFGSAPLLNLARNWSRALPLLLLGTLFQMFFAGPLGEEGGWRGFAQPRLERQHGPLLGCLILGSLWGCWHLVAFFGGWLGIPFSVAAFLFLILGAMGGAVIYGWVYNNTGSLLIAILLHAAMNAATGLAGMALPASMPQWLHTFTYTYGGLSSSILAATAVLVVLCTRGRLGYRPEMFFVEQQPAPG